MSPDKSEPRVYTAYELREALKGLKPEVKLKVTNDGLVLIADLLTPKPKEYRGDIDMDLVKKLLKSGIRKSEIARRLNTTRQTLHEAIKRQKHYDEYLLQQEKK